MIYYLVMLCKISYLTLKKYKLRHVIIKMNEIILIFGDLLSIFLDNFEKKKNWYIKYIFQHENKIF